MGGRGSSSKRATTREAQAVAPGPATVVAGRGQGGTLLPTELTQVMAFAELVRRGQSPAQTNSMLNSLSDAALRKMGKVVGVDTNGSHDQLVSSVGKAIRLASPVLTQGTKPSNVVSLPTGRTPRKPRRPGGGGTVVPFNPRGGS